MAAISLHEAPTHEIRVADAQAAAAAERALVAERPSVAEARLNRPAPAVSRVGDIVAAPPPQAQPASPLRYLVFGAVVVAVGLGGWLLWRGMTGRTGGESVVPATPAGYSSALAALAANDAAGASRQLRELLLSDRAERPGYLPHFYYGQALATLGQCDEALKSLSESERQGVLAASPEGALLPAARARCSGSPDLEAQLQPVESTLALLDQQIAEIEGSKTSTAVSRLWSSRPELEADLERARRLAGEARALMTRARSGGDLDLAFEAADRASDARDRLAGVLRAVDQALGSALAN